MSCTLVRKTGIPVLAYSTSDAASQLSGNLRVRYFASRMQATISLQFMIPVHDSTDAQSFTFVYDADNLVSGETSLGSAIVALSPAQLDEIARSGNPQTRLLSLKLKSPCPIWFPEHLGSVAAKIGFDAPYHQLVKLAGTTGIHVLFDYKWIHQNNRVLFQHIISHPEELTGLPAEAHLKTSCRQANWTVFSPVDDAPSEAPPSYTDASKKRSRLGEIIPT